MDGKKSIRNEAKVKLGKLWKDWGQSRSASENGGQARPLNTWVNDAGTQLAPWIY